MHFIRHIDRLSVEDRDKAGGKASHLGEVMRLGASVPKGFVILTSAFDLLTQEREVRGRLNDLIRQRHADGASAQLDEAIRRLRVEFLSTPIPGEVATEVEEAFQASGFSRVAVRSSAPAEDGKSHSWAGIFASHLNVTTRDLLHKIKECWASVISPRSLAYCSKLEMNAADLSTAVIIQQMIDAEVSGTCFTADPVTGDVGTIVIQAGWGLGEVIVQGAIIPDNYVIDRRSRELKEKTVNSQEFMLMADEGGGGQAVELPPERAEGQKLSDALIAELTSMALKIESHFGHPQDIEWSLLGERIYILQSRPITTI